MFPNVLINLLSLVNVILLNKRHLIPLNFTLQFPSYLIILQNHIKSMGWGL